MNFGFEWSFIAEAAGWGSWKDLNEIRFASVAI